MKEGLRIAADLTLPIDAVTQTLAAIGRKGAGKTYLATMLAEQMLDVGAQIAVIDPVGNWWGLRVGADGKSKGKDIFVIGGERGDVPIVPEAGARIARLLVEKRISAVLDISSFRQGERKRFAADFAEELFHLKKTQRTPVHIFLEEAQLFAPQRSGPDEARMLGAWESIVRLGRNYGIGCTMVTQRPQSVNKEVLSQVECLCVLQVNGAHERKALEEWVQEAGADRKLVGELPGLEQGEGYVWSPSWLRVFKRVRFARKKTFDASATPEVGKAAKAASLASVDVEALRADMAEVIATAELDDPKALRRRVTELEKLLRVSAMTQPETKVERVEVLVVKDAQIKRIEAIVERANAVSDKVLAAAADITASLRAAKTMDTRELPRQRQRDFPRAKPRPAPQAKPTNGEAKLGRAERRILMALAQHGRASKTKLAVLTGYSSGGGGFNNALGALRSQGLVAGVGELEITDAGVAAVGGFDPLPTGYDLVEHWSKQLGKAERLILRAVVDVYPQSLTKEEIARRTGYEVAGGGFNNALGKLRTLELVSRGSEIRAHDSLGV